MVFGFITSVAGFLGVVFGSLAATRWRRTNNLADPLICGLGLIIALPFYYTAINIIAINLPVAWVHTILCKFSDNRGCHLLFLIHFMTNFFSLGADVPYCNICVFEFCCNYRHNDGTVRFNINAWVWPADLCFIVRDHTKQTFHSKCDPDVLRSLFRRCQQSIYNWSGKISLITLIWELFNFWQQLFFRFLMLYAARKMATSNTILVWNMLYSYRHSFWYWVVFSTLVQHGFSKVIRNGLRLWLKKVYSTLCKFITV